MVWFTAVKTATGVTFVEQCDYHCGAAGAFGYLVDGHMRWFCAEHQLRRWSADACISEVEALRAKGKLWIKGVSAPDLQMYVARYGGYDGIPPEAWAEFDCAMAEYQAQHREKHRRK